MSVTHRKFNHRGYFHTRHCPPGDDGEHQYTPVSAFSRLEMAYGLTFGSFPPGMVLECAGVRWTVCDDGATIRNGDGVVMAPEYDHLTEVT